MKHSKSWRGTPEWYTWEGPHFVPNERKQPILPTSLPIPWSNEVNEPTNRSADMLRSLNCHQGGPKSTKERPDQLFEEDSQEIEQPCPKEFWSENSSDTSQGKASSLVNGSQETYHAEHHPDRKFATSKVPRYKASSQDSIAMAELGASPAHEIKAPRKANNEQVVSLTIDNPASGTSILTVRGMKLILIASTELGLSTQHKSLGSTGRKRGFEDDPGEEMTRKRCRIQSPLLTEHISPANNKRKIEGEEEGERVKKRLRPVQRRGGMRWIIRYKAKA